MGDKEEIKPVNEVRIVYQCGLCGAIGRLENEEFLRFHRDTPKRGIPMNPGDIFGYDDWAIVVIKEIEYNWEHYPNCEVDRFDSTRDMGGSLFPDNGWSSRMDILTQYNSNLRELNDAEFKSFIDNLEAHPPVLERLK